MCFLLRDMSALLVTVDDRASRYVKQVKSLLPSDRCIYIYSLRFKLLDEVIDVGSI